MNPGDVISRYRILGPLGKGGMGIVYKAEDTRLHRPVALKFLPPDSFDELDKQRFLHEAQAAAAARHPNICPIYDLEEADGVTFIVMAHLDGETLRSLVKRGPLPIHKAIDIASQVAAGLECAHQLGIVHRDIKSGNIMVSPDGHASILDFGLALVSGQTRLTDDGKAVGTAFYMSPEQVQGHPVDRRTDIWSLGIVLFEMLTGTYPFAREHMPAVPHAILTDPVPDVTALRASVPQELKSVLAKALARDPADRYQSAGDMARDLKALIVGSQASSPTQSIVSEASRRPQSPAKRKVAMGVGGVAVLVAAAFGVYWTSHRKPAPPPKAATAAEVLPLVREANQVAVLPFEVPKGSPESVRTVADGLSDALSEALTEMERVQGNIVAIPASQMRLQSISSVEQARSVDGVTRVVVGRAQPSPNGDVNFTLSLVDAVNQRPIGSQAFVYDMKKPVESRNQAVAIVASLMKAELAPATLTAIAAGDSGVGDAYGAYLHGRGLLARFDVAGNVDKAIASFKTAVRQDPNYALAYTGLAEAYWRLSNSGDKQAAELSRINAEQAVHLNPSLAISHTMLGMVYRDGNRKADAIREFQKAMEIMPGNAEAPREIAGIYAEAGRFDEAQALYSKAIQLRPTDWYGYYKLAVFYYQRERYTDAEDTLRKARALTPENELINRTLGAILLMHGRYSEAIDVLERELKRQPNAYGFTTLASAYFSAHRFSDAVVAGESALDMDASNYGFWGNLGSYYKWAPGHENKAPAALKRAIQLALKFLEARPADYNVFANLAEYRARLGDEKGALAEIEKIPANLRKPYITRIALAYELTGHRNRAIDAIRTTVTNADSLIRVKSDPDLAALWQDPAFQSFVQSLR